MVVVTTRVSLKPGRVEVVRDLFAKTNPDLVRDQSDWLGAKFTADRTADEVVVLAFWRSEEPYRALSESGPFRQAMEAFAPHFAGPPEVTVREVLYEM
jgi:heme-degrading monooxygenase HmoA